MKKDYTLLPYSLIVSALYCVCLLSSCQTSRLHGTDTGYASQSEIKLTQALAADQQTPLAEPGMIQASTEGAYTDDAPAAASTQTDLSAVDVATLAHPASMVRAPVARTTQSDAQTSAHTVQQVHKKLSLPARMMLKSMVKKAEKLQKKDITDAKQQKAVNNNSYLILGILLLVAGLVLVLVGNTTLLYVLGSVASLAGLIFLLLAIL